MKHDIEVTDGRQKPQKKPNLTDVFVDLLVCMIIPTLILKKLSGADMLGPTYALVAALSFPLLKGVWGFISERKIGFVPALGFISILLTGSIGIFKLPKEYIAYKEALIPAILCILTMVTIFLKKPIIRTFLYNDMILDTQKISSNLEEKGKSSALNSVLINATWMLAGSLALSSALNFLLAKFIVVSESGTDAFNSELGTMNLYTYPVIVLPTTIITVFAMFYVFKRILTLTGLDLEEIIQE